MIIFQSTWPQLDISPCSYQSYSVIALILLYLAVPFFTATGCFCLALNFIGPTQKIESSLTALSNASLNKACHLSDIAHHKALRSGSVSDWSSYRLLCNKANSMLRSAKARHFSDLSSLLRGDIFNLCPSLPNVIVIYNFQLLPIHLTNIILSIPHRTIADVTSTVPATEFVERFFDNRGVPFM